MIWRLYNLGVRTRDEIAACAPKRLGDGIEPIDRLLRTYVGVEVAREIFVERLSANTRPFDRSNVAASDAKESSRSVLIRWQDSFDQAGPQDGFPSLALTIPAYPKRLDCAPQVSLARTSPVICLFLKSRGRT